MEDKTWIPYKRNMNLPIQLKAKFLGNEYVCSKILNFVRIINDITEGICYYKLK